MTHAFTHIFPLRARTREDSLEEEGEIRAA